MTRTARALCALALPFSLAIAACGGSGGGGGPSGRGPLPLPAPDVVLLVVSGHAFSGDPAYLRFTAGPALASDLQADGYAVDAWYYVDGASADGAFGGYADLVADLEAVRDEWLAEGTRVVVVAHSHGGVWAHAAIRAVPDLPVEALVDLDCSSFGWALSGHGSESAYVGGDPEGAVNVGVDVTVPAWPGVPSQPGGIYDLEDVVFDSVVEELEVRSGEAPSGGEWYDEKWNCRASGTVTGLTPWFSGTSHAEVHSPGGATLTLVGEWLLAALSN